MNYANSAALTKPRRVLEPAAWAGHIPFAFWLMAAARPRTLVELGTHTGNSFCAFLQGADAQGLDTQAFAIDHWEGDPHAGLYSEQVYQELRTYVDAIYPDRATLIRSSFDDALDRFDDGSIDILHIDGMHTYDAVRRDFETWLPKVSANGLILLHDTSVQVRDFGVWKLLEELSAYHRTAQLPHSHGLGIVALGEQPEPIAALLEGRRDQAGLSSEEVFGRLGDAVLDAFHLSRFMAASDPNSRAGAIKRFLVENENEHSVLANALRGELGLRASAVSQYVETGRDIDVSIPQILATPYFWPAYYGQQIGSEDRSAWSLCRHYLTVGEKDGLSPSPLFDAAFYRRSNEDVAASRYAMLEHFALFGRREGRQPLPPEQDEDEAVGDGATEPVAEEPKQAGLQPDA